MSIASNSRPSDGDEELLLPRWIRIPVLSIFTAVMVCIPALLGTYVYRAFRHNQVATEMDTTIRRLAMDRPANVSKSYWVYCIYWTWNLDSSYGHGVPTDDYRRICRELNRRIDRGADVATIDWVWDQYVRSYPPAESYDCHRPTSSPNREAFVAGEHGEYSLSDLPFQYWREK